MTNIEDLFCRGLDFNHLYVLQNINNLPDVNKIIGYYEMLKKRDYITEDGILTLKGQEVIALFTKDFQLANQETSSVVNKNDNTVQDNKQTFSNWVVELHSKLQQKLKDIGVTEKVKLVFDGKQTNHPYFCSVVDLEGKIKKFISRYRMDDLKRIEACLLKHCEVRNQKLLMYILREGANTGSSLASDYESYVEEIISKPIKKADFF